MPKLADRTRPGQVDGSCDTDALAPAARELVGIAFGQFRAKSGLSQQLHDALDALRAMASHVVCIEGLGYDVLYGPRPAAPPGATPDTLRSTVQDLHHFKGHNRKDPDRGSTESSTLPDEDAHCERDPGIKAESPRLARSSAIQPVPQDRGSHRAKH